MNQGRKNPQNSVWWTYRIILWKTLFRLHCSVVDLHAAPRHKLDDRWAILLVHRGRGTVTVAIAIIKKNQKKNYIILCVDMFHTLFRTSVLSRSFTSMFKASSLSCGPRLQEMVMQALPGRSQSFKERQQGGEVERGGRERQKPCGKERCDKQMLHGVRKQGSSQEGDCQWPRRGQRARRGPHIYQDFATRLGEEGKYGMEDALLVLGDGARCRVLVRGAVTSTVCHLEKETIKYDVRIFSWLS